MIGATDGTAPRGPDSCNEMLQGYKMNPAANASLRGAAYAQGFRSNPQIPVHSKPRCVAFFGARLAVFVTGCFRHGCPVHATWPKNNAEFWRAKILANQQRDLDTSARLRAEGWEVVRVWAHEVPDLAAARIEEIVRSRRPAKESA